MSTVRSFENSRARTSLLTLGALGLIAAAVVAALPADAFAQEVMQNLNAAQQESGLGSANIYQIVGRILRALFGILGVIAVSICVYGGYKWMTAAGDTKQVEDAKMVLRNGVIGLTLIFLSFGITEFVLQKVFGATGFTSGKFEQTAGPGSDGDLGDYFGGSALGKVIEAHDPQRNAINVARNKNIMVMFKFPVDPESLVNTKAANVVYKTVKDADGKEVKRIAAGPLATDVVVVYPTKSGKDAALKGEEVWVTFAADGADTSVVTFDPIPFLGSASEKVGYTVELTSAIKRMQPKGQSAFSGFAGGYSWQFEVGTELDLTPPRVASVVPINKGTFDRNITIQITFTEPVNLASAIGDSKDFTNITARRKDGSIIPGRWSAGTGFNIVEFTPHDQCATNSCGQKIFCLPSKESIEVRAKAGVLEKVGVPQMKIQLGYTGVADTANNALDGGGEAAAKPWSTSGGSAAGSPNDDFFIGFATTEATKSSAPQVVTLEPVILGNAKSNPPVLPDSPVSVTFDSLMKVSTFTDVELVAKNPKAQAGFWKSPSTVTIKNAQGQDASVTKLTISHVAFAKNQPYNSVIPSTVQDIYQNCFLPTSGYNPSINLNCKAGASPSGTFSCCNGTLSEESCKL